MNKKITCHRGTSETVTNYISVTCPYVAGDNAIYDSIVTNDNNVTNSNCVTYEIIVTADNNVIHDIDLNDNSLKRVTK